jgi:hypothetical protein
VSGRGFTRRAVLAGMAAAAAAPRPAAAFGTISKVDVVELDLGPGTLSRPSAWERLLYGLDSSTSVAAAPTAARVTPEDPALFEHPFAVLLGDGAFAEPSDLAVERLGQFLAYGGFLFIDDTTGDPRSAFDASVRRLVARLFPTTALAQLPRNHALFHSFFLLSRVPGRLDRTDVLEGVTVGSLSPLVYGRNDLSGALERGPDGRYAAACVPGGERQRREALKVGVNLMMYALTANYKNDQAHVRELMLRQQGLVP